MERHTVCFIDVVAKNCTRHRRNVLGLEIVAAERRHDHEAAARRSALLLVSNVGGSPGRTLVLGQATRKRVRMEVNLAGVRNSEEGIDPVDRDHPAPVI